MKEILITSSVLIAVLLVLRAAFRKTISRRLQYALWGLVLVRLLVPVNLPAAGFSVLSAAEPVEKTVSSQLGAQEVYVLPVNRSPISDYPTAYGLEPGALVPTAESFGYNVVSGDGVTVTKYAEKVTLGEALTGVWLAGGAVMTVFLTVTNLRFWRKIRKVRTPYTVDGCDHPVYLVETGLPSPCLFGLFRPAIYLTPAAVATPEGLGHVLAHESTHARHRDPLWSLLRCLCLAVYWFDPLVWIAAAVSRTDCELACDEGALRRLGQEQRIPYGKTLLSLIPVRKGPANPLLSATTMTAGKRQLRDRITRIAENRQTRAAALFAVVALAAAVCAVTFTGAASPSAKTDLSDFQLETTVSLADAEEIKPMAVQTTEISSAEIAWRLGTLELANDIVVGWGYLADRSTVYWYAESQEAETLHCFITKKPTDYLYGSHAEPFDNILGQTGFQAGFRVDYEAGTDLEPYIGAGDVYDVWRYYYFKDGTLYRLASVPGAVTEAPWPDTLLGIENYREGAALLYFRRDGTLYQANLTPLLQQAYPHWDALHMGWDEETGMLVVSGYREEDWAFCRRYGVFDGGQLLLYKDARTLNAHVLGAPDVSEDVLTAAKDMVSQFYQRETTTETPFNVYDDWRVESLSKVYTYAPADKTDFYGREIEVYQLNYEFHTTTPLADVVLAGGMYVTEDSWVMPGYPDCTYLLFQVQNGRRTFLYSTMQNDCAPGSQPFTEGMEYAFLSTGDLTIAGMTQTALWSLFREQPLSALTKLSACYDQEQDLGCRSLAWALAETPMDNLFSELNRLGLAGRQAQTLDLLRYYAGDLSYDTLPQEVLDLYKQVAAAWAQKRSAAEPITISSTRTTGTRF